MDTKKLRQKILDLAIRGKLVPQDPNDEPASVLLERIKAEKERLIKEGKIKRSKKSASDTSHYENWPFEIPESWEWVQLKDIAFIGTGSTPKTTNQDYYGGNIPWINSSSTRYEYVEVPNAYITEKALKETNCQIYPIGTIVIAMYGEGKTRGQVSELAIASTTNQACAAIIPFDSAIKAYIKAFLKGNYYAIRTLAEGGLQPNLNIGKISDYMIPLPPEKEQKRIISEVHNWLSLIDKIENERSDLFSIIQKIKIKVLDLAIHGNLVPQNPAEEPAIELLNRINSNIEIPCDNPHYPFDIPQRWSWVNLGALCSFLSRGKSPKYSEERKYPVFAQKCNLYNGDISLEQARFLDPSTLSKWDDIYKLREGDVLMNSTGTGTVGRTRVFHSDCLGTYPFAVPDSHVSVIRTFDSIESKYIHAYLSSKETQRFLEDNLAGSTNQKELYIGVLDNLLIPLPPQNEQKRIVEEIDRYFNTLDKIKESLTA